MRRRKRRHPSLVKLKDGYYENGHRLRREDYAYCSSCTDGNSIVSYITGSKYRLDSRLRPL